METFQSIIFGIIQGAGEFLPISSTAHLILVPYFTGWKDPGLSFDIALHLGTLIALVLFFWRDWIEIFSQFITHASKPKEKYKGNLFWLIVIATVPGVLAGYFLEAKAETVFRNPLIVAFALSFVGLILFLTDKYLKHKKNIGELNWKDSLIVGISQAIAIIPGVSRSGATITAGIFRGLNRTDAARFSFLLSTPIILGAFIFKSPELFSEGINLNIIIGIIFSALSGYLAIKYLLKFVEKYSYGVFFWYRLGLAILITIFHFTGLGL